MTHKVSVIVPYSPGLPHRDRIWKFIKSRFNKFQVLTVDDPIKSNSGFNKAAAIISAIPMLKYNIVVMTDADVWCDGLMAAISAVKDGSPFAIPHSKIHRLQKRPTKQLLAGKPADLTQVVKIQNVVKGGGVIVLTKDLLFKHPPDTRFMGWGWEDKSWFFRLNTFCPGYWQGNQVLYHMWHPCSNRNHGNKHNNRVLGRRYQAAHKDVQKMTQLISE